LGHCFSGERDEEEQNHGPPTYVAVWVPDYGGACNVCSAAHLGSMQTRRDAIAIVSGILIITAIGEHVRRFRLKHTEIRPAEDKGEA
jgi:hypothetical protein